ncbi:MAG TPA: hypothetical protein VK973_14745 [Arenicellales bacterium]|nr:hypothetical protein [Arenicellales bacterium]
MTHRDQLVEQHIRLHESHLKHIDEMLRRAHEHVEAGSAPPDAEKELAELKGERERLAGELSEMKRREPQQWELDTLSRSGPMGVWDAVAQRLEKLMERLD